MRTRYVIKLQMIVLTQPIYDIQTTHSRLKYRWAYKTTIVQVAVSQTGKLGPIKQDLHHVFDALFTAIPLA